MRDLVTMADVIGVVEKGLKAFSFGDVVQPVRSVVKVSEYNGYVRIYNEVTPVILTRSDTTFCVAVTTVQPKYSQHTSRCMVT